MTDGNYRILKVISGFVECLPEKKENTERCRFCVHSRKFMVNGVWYDSPARTYCMACRTTRMPDYKNADAVMCDDLKIEGFRSFLNIIS
jgi:hypothetical protein